MSDKLGPTGNTKDACCYCGHAHSLSMPCDELGWKERFKQQQEKIEQLEAVAVLLLNTLRNSASDAYEQGKRDQQAYVERLQYGHGQHDIICELLGVGKTSDDPGPTAFEAVSKLNAEVKPLRDTRQQEQTTYEGWKVVKDYDDGSMILQSHTGERRHVWQGCDEAAQKEIEALKSKCNAERAIGRIYQDDCNKAQREIEALRGTEEILMEHLSDQHAKIERLQDEIEKLRKAMVIMFGKMRLTGSLQQHDQLPSISRCMELWPELADVTWETAIRAAKEVGND